MIVAVLRASAIDFDVDDFVAEFPDLQPERIWHRGDVRLRQDPTGDSGLNKTLAEGDVFGDVMRLVRQQLSKLAPALSSLRERRVVSVVDIGMTLELGRHLSRSVRFKADDIALLEHLGLDVEVSAYISSGDRDA